MAIAIHRTRKDIDFSADTPSFPALQWLVLQRGDSRIDTLRTLLTAGVLSRHIKIDGSDQLSEMSTAEKQAVDDAAGILVCQSDAAGSDPDGVPVVNAGAINMHTVTIRKRNLAGTLMTTGSERIRIVPQSMCPCSDGFKDMVNGVATFTVGPSGAANRGTVEIKLFDNSGNFLPTGIKLRFR